MNQDRVATSVQINGPALRCIRERDGRSIGSLARAAGVSTSFLARVEKGLRPGVRVQVFEVLLAELRITDPRALRANPYEPVGAAPAAAVA